MTVKEVLSDGLCRVARIPIDSEANIPDAICELLKSVDWTNYTERLHLEFSQLPNVPGAHVLHVPVRLVWQYDIMTDTTKLSADIAVEERKA